MNLPDLPLLGVLKERMSWLNARQGVLSQNVANADTPGYLARDMKAQDFGDILKGENRVSPALTPTAPRHIGLPQNMQSDFASAESPDTESNPTGNTVSLEEEMIKVADTQAQYSAAANLYSK